MTCRPPCCKRDPERQCPLCYTDQTWELTIPPTEIVRLETGDKFVASGYESLYTPDLLKDGTGDATTGTCGNGVSGRNGTDGFDSHTYIDGEARDLDSEVGTPRTENGDSLPRPVLTNDNIIVNQLVGGRAYGVYGVPHVRTSSFYGTASRPWRGSSVGLWGGFHIPASSLLEGTFTKTGQFRMGLDRAGPVELFSRVPSDPADWRDEDYFSGVISGQLEPFTTILFPFINGSNGTNVDIRSTLAWVRFSIVGAGNPVTPRIVENGDDISDADFVGRSINDRRVFMEMRNYGASGGTNGPGGVDDGGGSANNSPTLIYDTGVLFGDVLDGSLFLQLEVEQTAQPLDGKLTFSATYSIPQSGFELIEPVTVKNLRCMQGTFTAVSRSFDKKADNIYSTYTGPFQRLPGTPNNVQVYYDVCTQDPAWWVNDLNSVRDKDNDKFIATFPWVDTLRLTDGTFADTAFLIVSSLRHRDSSGNTKTLVTAADYDDITIPNGTAIDLGVIETGDDIVLTFDNPGEETVEISSITFDDPWLKTVSDSSPTILPYELSSVTFTTELVVAPNTDADIVVTHDSNGDHIPSPYTLTLTGAEVPGDGGGPGDGGAPG